MFFFVLLIIHRITGLAYGKKSHNADEMTFEVIAIATNQIAAFFSLAVITAARTI